MMGGEQNFIHEAEYIRCVPPIFASSLLLLPLTIVGFSGADGGGYLNNCPSSATWSAFVHVLVWWLIALFWLFLQRLCLTRKMRNAEKYGGFVPGIRPGQPTADYLDTVLTRITAVGALYLIFNCLLPELPYPLRCSFYFGGTGLLIVVTVTLDTVAQIHSHMIAHQ